ncbi:AHH domain-containing protein [Microbulbifer sp. OS29]|uniref:AHH domain-containing protein n=1 Tax=Microbulbifer okhotskensis TaxID=2926617 RepID=A0A9X2ENE3_9GAMM|nr:AHH domain-containing protein [Microbulbifer okhotskensis]MCO1334869.1 AHH domain-containing protein [Microbulbifer okhotskensis]
MEIEYKNGNRVTLFPHEMTPLEAAIAGFESKAKKYYQKKSLPKPETEEDRIKREQDLDAALEHLKSERRKISIFAQIQSGLEEYQAKGRKQAEEDPLEMLKEKHHPTTVLAQNMRADGRPQPSNRHSPHHIVEGRGKHPRTADTRLNLHLYGIRINDPDNGVWLPRTKSDKGHWSMPSAPAHSEIHTFNYESWVSFLIGSIEDEFMIRAALLRIRSLLRDGKQPQKVTEKKDVNWRPSP